MRIWDVHPGYLNRGSLLGEHRELHAIWAIITQDKRGYARHPETLRWRGHLAALRQRHELLVAEMALRGYRHFSPLPPAPGLPRWPTTFVNPPGDQLTILGRKYRDKESGRIPLPADAAILWASHKYSVLARDQRLYRSIGRQVADPVARRELDDLAALLVGALRQPPTSADLRNALQHMWGHVSRATDEPPPDPHRGRAFLQRIIELNELVGDTYLARSTALTDLAIW